MSCGKFIVWGFVSVTFMTEKTFAMNQRGAEPSQTPGNQAHTQSWTQQKTPHISTELECPSFTQFYASFIPNYLFIQCFDSFEYAYLTLMLYLSSFLFRLIDHLCLHPFWTALISLVYLMCCFTYDRCDIWHKLRELLWKIFNVLLDIVSIISI